MITLLPFLILAGCSNKFESELKNSCAEMGGSSKMCKCIYNKLEDHYGEKRLKKAADTLIMPADYDDVAAQVGRICLAKELS